MRPLEFESLEAAMQQIRAYPYVSHLVPLPPGAAELGFDLACDRLASAGKHPAEGDGRGWMLSAPSGCLLVVSATRPETPPRGYYPSRRLRGVLRPAGWGAPAVSIDVELLPWSSQYSELAVAPVTRERLGPGRRRQQRYLRAAHGVLDLLVEAVSAPLLPLVEHAEQDALARARRRAPVGGWLTHDLQ